MRRILRQQCDNTDWSVVEDHSEKLCTYYAERCEPRPVVLQPQIPVIQHPSDPVTIEPSGPVLRILANIYTQYDEYGRHSAAYVHARLNAWLMENPEREARRDLEICPELDITSEHEFCSGGDPYHDEHVEVGAEYRDLMVAMSGLDILPAEAPTAAGSTGDIGSALFGGCPGRKSMLFVNMETASSEEIDEIGVVDKYGFEKQKVSDGAFTDQYWWRRVR